MRRTKEHDGGVLAKGRGHLLIYTKRQKRQDKQKYLPFNTTFGVIFTAKFHHWLFWDEYKRHVFKLF